VKGKKNRTIPNKEDLQFEEIVFSDEDDKKQR